MRDSYEVWLGGAGDGHAPAQVRQRPELSILRGKLRLALSRSGARVAAAGREPRGPHDFLALLQGADFAGAGRLDWASIVRILVEDLRLTIDAPTPGGLSADDHAIVARQLARADEAARQSVPPVHSEQDEAGLLLARDEELALLRAYREGHKAEVVRARLQDAITASSAIYPRFGQVRPFPLPAALTLRSIAAPYALTPPPASPAAGGVL